MSRALKPCSLAASLLCLGLSVQAQSQTATPAATQSMTGPEAQAAADAGLQLEKVVVTGTTTGRSKMLQSVSVSTLSADKIAKSGAASSAELLRTVPGLRAESSGGEGNANMTVRGAPISAGGSRYLQLQEDGLPLLLIGDISFATADQFLRADAMVDSVQVVRGGSASTTATNAPAGIVNFLSKTGAQPGGSLAVSAGLDHRQARVEFDAGSKLSDSMSYQLAGYYRLGEGVRPSDVDLEDGGQLRLNLTQRFAGGFLRLHLKNLDDRTPTYLPVPVQLNGNRIERLAGIDPRTAFFFNSRLPQDVTADRNGNRVVSNPADGLQVKNRSVGLELDADVGNGFRLNSKLRRSEISGRFIGAFPAGSAPTAAANGANRYTGSAPVFSMHVFNSALDDMGNVFSDTRLARVFDLGAGLKLTGTAGLFWGRQTVAQTWFWNRYNVELKGEGARILDNAGNPTTLPVGLGTTTWGGCCVRAMDVDVTAAAPYAAATLDIGPWSIDASLRRDRLRGSGWTQEDNTPAADGSFTGWNPASRANVAWSSSHSSYSLGANYAVSRDLAVFGRASKGVSLSSPDRQFGSAAMTGGQPYPVNELQ
ncbi:MAG: TonB-dependent receptor plug domain-containing protein, partial [Inhella sp.]